MNLLSFLFPNRYPLSAAKLKLKNNHVRQNIFLNVNNLTIYASINVVIIPFTTPSQGLAFKKLNRLSINKMLKNGFKRFVPPA